MNGLVHVRLRGARRSPHRVGRITPGHILDADPRRRTVCGAEPTDRDLLHHQARWKSWRRHITCGACFASTVEVAS